MPKAFLTRFLRSRCWKWGNSHNLLAIIAIALGFVFAAAGADVWTDDSFEDFSRGRLDAAGNNIYVSRDGALRTIHRFDLNRDGYLDLVFNSTHDYSYFQSAVAASARGTVELPVDGSRRVAVADLNRDGFADAVFCPSDSGLQSPRRYLKIAWGSAAGFSASRISGVLPVYGAVTAIAADVNRDSWPDIVVLNQKAWAPGQPAGNIVRVYWGSAAGFQPSKFKDFGVAAAVDLVSADGKDVAVLTKSSVRMLAGGQSTPLGVNDAAAIAADSKGRLIVATATKTLLVAGNVSPLDAQPAVHAAAADLDGDGADDYIFTGPRGVRVLWSGRPPATEIPLSQATAAAAVDFNGDGRLDLAVAVHQSETRLATDSLIYYGKGSRQFERGATVPTSGAAHVAAAGTQAIFANSLGGTVAEKVPIYVYWGAPGGFANAKRWEIPLQSGYESSAADLNNDGWPDLIVLNSGHVGEVAEGEATLGANILWGSEKGFDLARRTVLAESDIGSSTVADLDRDGYLDIVLGAFDTPRKRDRLVIYYGGPNGFSKARRQALADTGRAVSLSLADLDGDGWLDIAAVDSTRDRVLIYPGSPKGFDPKRLRTIDVPFAISLEVADLNGDGRLDLAVGSYQDRESGMHDGGLYLFWGSAKGFEQANSQWLPGFAPIGMAAADFDGDGYLDIFSPHYLGNGTRESVPSYLYWGSKDGFHPRRRTALITDSAHDAMAADFDGDGRLDLAVSCHTTDGDHHGVSRIFYNDGHRFANPRLETLPTIGPHWMWDQDIGHIATRAWRQTYESRVFEARQPVTRVSVEAAADAPPGTRLLISLRGAATKADLEARPWIDAPDSAVTFETAARFVQYRLTLVSTNGDRYPTIDRVTLQTR